MSDNDTPLDGDGIAPGTTPRRAPGSSFQSQVRAKRSEIEQHLEKARADFESANERINQRSGRPLFWAIGIGVLIVVVVFASLIFLKWTFVALAVPAVLLGVYEFSRALQASGRKVDVIPQLVAAAGILLAAAFLGHFTHWVITYAAIAILIVWRLLAQMTARDGRRYGDVLADALVAGFIVLYVPLLASLALILLRQDRGEFWVLTMILVVVAADTGAYAAGVAWGRHPMAPRISPKKTWEGFGGAAVAAVAAAVLLGVFLLNIPWWAAAIFGVAVLLSATVGDLGESMIKRDLGIKDMSSALPGHGGVLDRLDSMLPSTVPALALFFLFSPLAAS